MMAPLTVVAHRGASAVAPENTVAAFRRALELGADVIEADVRSTKDGEFVLVHDADLTRVAGRPEGIDTLECRDLAAIVVGTDPVLGPQAIPRLRDLLRLARGRARILLDLKSVAGNEADLLHEIRRAGAEDEVIFGIHTVAEVEIFRRLAPRIARLSFAYPLERVWETLEAGVDVVRLWSMWVDAQTVTRATGAGMPVWVMCGRRTEGEVGIATREDLLAYRRLGVAGAILNDPRLAVQANSAT